MKLYDKLIGQIKNLLPENAKRFSYSEPTLKIKKRQFNTFIERNGV